MIQLLPTTACDESGAWPHRVSLFGIELDAVTMGEAVARLLSWIHAREVSCRYVVTPNVDHVVTLQQDSGMRRAYKDASLVVADGWPIVAASWWLRQPVPERVAGSDLVPQLFSAAERLALEHRAAANDSSPVRERILNTDESGGSRTHVGDDRGHLRVYLLGAAPGVAERAARNIHATWPTVRVVGYESPPLGFEKSPQENDAIVARVASVQPDVLIIGLGAPKQELWVHAHRDRLPTKVAVCAGATIDFLAGEKGRAPRWMRRTGLEWLHRVCSEPRRLARRYLRGAVVFPRLAWSERNRLRCKT